MSPEIKALAARNLALRLAFAVTFGMTLEVLRDAALPPLAAVVALQLIAASGQPPGKKLIVALIGVSALAGAVAYIVSYVATSYAGLYTIGTALLYFWGFFLAYHPKVGALGALVLTISIVISALSAASTAVAGAILLELLTSFFVAFAVIFVAHALFPHPGPAGASDRSGVTPPIPPLPRAALATVIIMPLHLYLTSDGVAAMIVLMTAATMLRQSGIAQSTRYSVTFALGNLAGALLAAFSWLLLSTHDELPLMVAVIGASALILAGQIARGPRVAAIFVPGFVSYTMLLGLTLSSLPLADDVAVISRVASIIAAAVYVLAAASLLLPAVRRRLALSRAPAT
jgi:hypothetical protein